MAYTLWVDPSDVLDECTGFDWDDGNLEKNWDLHRVAFWEAEEVFFNRPLVVEIDRRHSTPEERRFWSLGVTDSERHLFISFTVRNSLLRVISARDMSRRELRIYGYHKA